MEIEKKFAEALIKAEKDCYSAEHILKVILPVVKDQKLLLRVLENVHRSAIEIISLILKYEYLCKRINLSVDVKENQNIFFKKCIFEYGLNSKEATELKELIVLGKKHQKSGFEFLRKNKVVIMNDDLSTISVTREVLEEDLKILRKLLLNARVRFSQSN